LERVDVTVGQPGDDHCGVQVDRLCGRAELPDLGIAPDRHDLTVGYRERRRSGLLGIERTDARPDEREVDTGHGYSPR
jgi:hypothetical protein